MSDKAEKLIELKTEYKMLKDENAKIEELYKWIDEEKFDSPDVGWAWYIVDADNLKKKIKELFNVAG